MRNTEALVDQLAEAALSLWTAAIIVGYEERTELVFYRVDEKAVLDELNGHLARGGTPMGIAGVEKGDSGFTVRTRLFAELRDDPRAHEYLSRLEDSVREALFLAAGPGFPPETEQS